jgi:hypothetical protein
VPAQHSRRSPGIPAALPALRLNRQGRENTNSRAARGLGRTHTRGPPGENAHRCHGPRSTVSENEVERRSARRAVTQVRVGMWPVWSQRCLLIPNGLVSQTRYFVLRCAGSRPNQGDRLAQRSGAVGADEPVTHLSCQPVAVVHQKATSAGEFVVLLGQYPHRQFFPR